MSPTIIFWTSLVNREFAAALILSLETLDCRVTFRDIAHRNDSKCRDSKSVWFQKQCRMAQRVLSMCVLLCPR
jgi:hypothetical protein